MHFFIFYFYLIRQIRIFNCQLKKKTSTWNDHRICRFGVVPDSATPPIFFLLKKQFIRQISIHWPSQKSTRPFANLEVYSRSGRNRTRSFLQLNAKNSWMRMANALRLVTLRITIFTPTFGALYKFLGYYGHFSIQEKALLINVA